MPHGKTYWHVTFHPYRRAPALWDGVEGFFYELVDGVAKRLGFTVLKVVAMPDHVHLLLDLPPGLDLIEVIRQVKGYTARRILQRLPELRGDMRSPGLWASGYHYVRHTEASLPTVLRYVESQKVRGGLE